MSFKIDLSKTTDVLSRYYRQFMEAEQAGLPKPIRGADFPEVLLRTAGEQWAGRAVASYYAMAQMACIHQQLIALGSPVEVLAGSMQSLEDSYRTMISCARLSRSLASTLELEDVRGIYPEHLALFPNEADPLVGVYKATLVHFGFNSTLSIPMFDALATIVTDDGISEVCMTIAASLEEEAEYGWGLLQWLNEQLNDSQKVLVCQALPGIMTAFERRCFGNSAVLEELAGNEVIVEQQEPNLGTLSEMQYAAIFYHTMTESIFPKMQEMGIDAPAFWRQHYRLGQVYPNRGMGIVAIDIMA